MKKKNITQIAAVLLSVILALSACGASANNAQENYKMDSYGAAVMSEPAMEAPAAMPMAPMAEERGFSADSASVAPTTQERVVIQTVDMGIVVPDPVGKMDQVAAMAERFGGYVVSRYTYQNQLQNGVTVPEGSIAIRVPADRLDEALAEIETGVTEVRYENRDGQDVTDQYVDLQSRLTAKQAAEKKLLQIMESAATAEETLMVFNQLQSVQSDIEVLKGQINYYDQASAMASISIGVSADETIQPIEIGGWEFRGEVKDAVESLVRFGQNFVSFFIWFIIYLLPVLAVVILFVWVLWKVFGGMIRKLFKRGEKPSAEDKKE